jgi:hypothetical protein
MNYNIQHPSRIIWKVSLPTNGDILSIYGDRTKKDLLNSIKKLVDTDYRFQIEPITKGLLNLFIPIYDLNVKSMKNGNYYDLDDLVFNKPKPNSSIECLSLYHGNIFLGGILFRKRKDMWSQIAKVFPKKLEINLKLNITFLAEYELYKYAISQHVHIVSLGVDTNLYGKIGNIGLAIYKLRTGAQAYVPRRNNNVMSESFDFNRNNDENTLVFMGSSGTEVTQAKLFICKGNTSLDNYSHLLNNNKIKVEVVY